MSTHVDSNGSGLIVVVLVVGFVVMLMGFNWIVELVGRVL